MLLLEREMRSSVPDRKYALALHFEELKTSLEKLNRDIDFAEARVLSLGKVCAKR